jgi:uncharacterized lipoprotein YajG
MHSARGLLLVVAFFLFAGCRMQQSVLYEYNGELSPSPRNIEVVAMDDGN